ncbi:hypothetical protein DH09_11675 [Bacillaceae bacterium JMAK1]|nr:hypothetical protein DH09_11675 [Bacillaceae bacterium JMAK1]
MLKRIFIAPLVVSSYFISQPLEANDHNQLQTEIIVSKASSSPVTSTIELLELDFYQAHETVMVEGQLKVNEDHIIDIKGNLTPYGEGIISENALGDVHTTNTKYTILQFYIQGETNTLHLVIEDIEEGNSLSFETRLEDELDNTMYLYNAFINSELHEGQSSSYATAEFQDENIDQETAHQKFQQGQKDDMEQLIADLNTLTSGSIDINDYEYLDSSMFTLNGTWSQNLTDNRGYMMYGIRQSSDKHLLQVSFFHGNRTLVGWREGDRVSEHRSTLELSDGVIMAYDQSTETVRVVQAFAPNQVIEYASTKSIPSERTVFFEQNLQIGQEKKQFDPFSSDLPNYFIRRAMPSVSQPIRTLQEFINGFTRGSNETREIVTYSTYQSQLEDGGEIVKRMRRTAHDLYLNSPGDSITHYAKIHSEDTEREPNVTNNVTWIVQTDIK